MIQQYSINLNLPEKGRKKAQIMYEQQITKVLWRCVFLNMFKQKLCLHFNQKIKFFGTAKSVRKLPRV